MNEKEQMRGMTEQRLAEIIIAYGADADRWPDAERAAATELLGRSPDARTRLSEAAHLDLILDHLPVAETPSAGLVDRIMAARPRALPAASLPRSKSRATGWRVLWPYSSPVLPTGALAFSMMLGIVVGTSIQSQADITSISQADSDQLVVLALAESNYPEEWQP
jgi:hypothetical protein